MAARGRGLLLLVADQVTQLLRAGLLGLGAETGVAFVLHVAAEKVVDQLIFFWAGQWAGCVVRWPACALLAMYVCVCTGSYSSTGRRRGPCLCPGPGAQVSICTSWHSSS